MWWQQGKVRGVMMLAAIGSMLILVAFSRRVIERDTAGEHKKNDFRLMSPQFQNRMNIPSLYTCDGQDVSPAISWQNPPAGTQSLVLICHDPDAQNGSWVHWIVFDIPSSITELPEHSKATSLNAKLGINSWGKAAYGGPCPPIKRHRYIFTLYALNIPQLALDKEPEYVAIKAAMQGHILDEARLIGMYQRMQNQ